jgi:polysaccharide export outer membrane protein
MHRQRFVTAVVLAAYASGCATIDQDALERRAAADRERPAPVLEPFPQPPAETRRAPEPYRLGVGDVVRITVYQNDELAVTQAIRPDGKIAVLPSGEVTAAGLTADELRQKVSAQVARFVREPVVGVVIDEYNSRRVAVLGAVKRPGILRLRSDVALLEGLSQLGGITEDADLRRAMFFRDGALLPVSLERLFRQGDISQNVLLRADDVVFIPTIRDNKVYLIGEVRTPGVVSWSGEMSLLQALPLAGGLTDDARAQSVLLIRGGLVDPHLELVDVRSLLAEGKLENDLAVAPGDVVFVPKSTMANTERYLDLAIKVMQGLLSLESAMVLGGSVRDVLQGATGAGTSIILNP